MAEKISVETNDLEQIICQSLHITQLLEQISNKITDVTNRIPNISSEGSFHDLIATNSTNGGLALFSLKAKEFLTLSEVFAQHIQNTYETMVDVDRALAIYVLEMFLNDPYTSEEDKQFIRDNPDSTLETCMENIKQAKETEEGGEES